MSKGTTKSKLAEYFLSVVVFWEQGQNIKRGLLPLLVIFFVLAGCEDRGGSPVIKTIYIEENKKLPTNDEFDHTINNTEKVESEEKVEPPKRGDGEENEISSVVEKIIKKEVKPDVMGKAVETQPNIQPMETLKFALVPSNEPPTVEGMKIIDDIPDNTSQLKVFEENEENREKLEIAALEAAFEMLAKGAEPVQVTPKKPNYGSKNREKLKFRIGLLIPLSGPFSHLGDIISGGSELAYFKMQNPNVELLYFDTGGGDKVVDAANSAIESGVDVIIGPLFSESVDAIKPSLTALEIPILSFSNNVDVAEPGVWVLGYLPEQQITQLVDYAVARGKQNFGILSSSSQLGEKITEATINQLNEYGLSPRTVLSVDNVESMEQNDLIDEIKGFAQYIDTEKDSLTLPPPVFDTVVIAGDTNFILQVAPILSYYDLGPDRALFIGIDRWNRPNMLNEPSLQNAILTLPKRPADEKFNKVWKTEFLIESNDLAKISFDATALVIATSSINSEVSLSERLVNQPGFIGFSGQFKMSKSGLTERVFEIMKISDKFLVKPSTQ